MDPDYTNIFLYYAINFDMSIYMYTCIFVYEMAHHDVPVLPPNHPLS